MYLACCAVSTLFSIIKTMPFFNTRKFKTYNYFTSLSHKFAINNTVYVLYFRRSGLMLGEKGLIKSITEYTFKRFVVCNPILYINNTIINVSISYINLFNACIYNHALAHRTAARVFNIFTCFNLCTGQI